MTINMRRMMPNARDHARGGQSPGATEIAVLLDSSTLAIAGWSSAALPAAGEVAFEDHSRGVWRALSYAEPISNRASATRFFALIGFDNVAQLHGGGFRVDPIGGGKAVQIPPSARIELDAAPLVAALHMPRTVGASVVDFVRAAASDPPFSASENLHLFMRALLRATSQQDGFVEILAQPNCGGALVQGWSFGLKAGKHTLLLEHQDLKALDCVAGTFSRSDLVDTAQGVVAYVKDAPNGEAAALQRVYYRTGDGYGHLDLVENPLRLEPGDVSTHLGQTLATVTADTEVRRALKRVCRPRFEGINTVDTCAAPVRAAVDQVLYAPGTGFLISGWMLDPRKLVKLALLKSTANFYFRIHDTWHRTARGDVSDGFTADPNFAKWLQPADNLHGFLVSIPRKEPLADGENFYLELVLEDESCAFLPVSVAERVAADEARAILSGVNIDDPVFDAIVERHLGPAISAAFAQRTEAIQATSPIALGDAAENVQISVVIPVEDNGDDLDINLARLAADVDLEQAEFLFVAPRAKSDRLVPRLRQQVAFYGLHGSLMLSTAPLDHFDALELGATHAQAELVLFLSQSVFPKESNWLGQLISELELHPGCVAISPTLLYEDYSIRYAGTSAGDESPDDAAPHLTGYSHHWLTANRPRRVTSIAAECCLVRRSAFEGLNGFSREFAAADFKATDFALRATASGAFCLWTPNVTMFALDPDTVVEPTDYWLKPARRVDEWRFVSKWGQAQDAHTTLREVPTP